MQTQVNKIKVIHYFDKVKVIPNKSGHGKLEKHHEWVLNKETGIEEWKLVSETNLDAIIQANRDTCDLKYIARQLANGNDAVLRAQAGLYCDATQLPKNLHEAHAMGQYVKGIFKRNEILQKIFKNEEEYNEALLNRKDIASMILEYRNKETEKLLASYKKESKIEKTQETKKE